VPVSFSESPAGLLSGAGGPDALVLSSGEANGPALRSRIGEMLDPRSWLPEPGQGIVAIVGRYPIAEVTALDHLPTRTALRAELALLDALDPGPDAAFGWLAKPSGRLLRLWAAVLTVDGRRLVRSDLTGPLDEPELLGAAVGRQLVQRGADMMLEVAST
jgi:hydroxymethylbilane synthase